MAASATVNGPSATLQPRMRHTGPNFMDGKMTLTTSTSLSESFQLFQLPDPCFVIRGTIKGSVKAAGAAPGAQCSFKLGTSKGDATFGTYTISGTAVLASVLNFYGPITLSSSGGAFSASNPQFYPVVATVASALGTSTISTSLYVMMEYVMPGNIGGNTGQGL